MNKPLYLNDFVLNAMSGMGGPKDKAVSNRFTLRLIDRDELNALYRSDWLARKCVDIIPQDMTREWRTWQAKDSQIGRIAEVEKTLRVRDKVSQAMQWARLYGGAALLMGAGSDDPREPLDVNGVQLGGLRYLHVFNRWELSSEELVMDPESEYFGEPAMYQMTGSVNRNQVNIHPSRVIRFINSPLPDRTIGNDGWGDSLLQIIYDAVSNASSTQQQIASLVTEAKLDIISVPNLSAQLATAEGTARVTARFSAASMIKSMYNTLLIEGNGKDTGEVWQTRQINFAAFPDLLKMFLQVAAGAADIPVTRLLGQSPMGLNATGDSDVRNYYDHLAALQEVQLRPVMSRLDEVIIRSALGRRPPNIWFNWNELWQLSDVEKADIALKNAQTTELYATNNGIPAAVLREAVRNQVIEGANYPGIQHSYAEYDAGILKAPTDTALAPRGTKIPSAEGVKVSTAQADT